MPDAKRDIQHDLDLMRLPYPYSADLQGGVATAILCDGGGGMPVNTRGVALRHR